MAQTRKKRRKKHRGTQAGTVDRAASTARSGGRSRGGATTAAERREERFNRKPSLRGALNRAAFAALIFGVLLYFWFEQPATQAALLSAFMLLVYVPMGYFTDRLLYERRQRKREEATQAAKGR